MGTVEKTFTELLHQVDQGQLTVRATEAGTVSELYERWVKHMAALGGWGDSSISSAGYSGKSIDRHIGHLKLSALTTRNINDFYVALAADENKAAATLRKIHSHLARALDKAVDEGELPVNPATRAKLPSVPTKRVTAPDVDTIKKIMRQLDNDADFRLIVLLAASTGARRGELAALRWPDFDLEAGTVTIARSISQVSKQEPVEKSTKTGQIRTVNIAPQLVDESTFFYYGPARVHRAIPDAWTFASSQEILAARYVGMDRALQATYGDVLIGAEINEAAQLVREAAAGCSRIGRVIHAGWASLEWPDQPHLALWHGCTLLREYRSGNHLMAVCNEGLDGCDAVVSHVAVGGAPGDWIQDEAAWTADDEARSIERLQARGWLDSAGVATAECHDGRGRIEDLTDRLDLPVWESLGETKGRRLFELLSELGASLPPDDQLDWQHHYPEAR